MSKYAIISLIVVISCAVFVAGIVDIAFPDVVPIRPYTSFFMTNLQDPAGSSLPAFWSGVHLAMIVLPVIAILILVIFPCHGFTIPPLVIGHGKSTASHKGKPVRMSRKELARKILKKVAMREYLDTDTYPQDKFISSKGESS